MAVGYQERTYRRLVRGHLEPLVVTVQQTDLSVYAHGLGAEMVREAVIEQRGYIEGYIQRQPEFEQTLMPWPHDPSAPAIVREMIEAGQAAKVGPMAAVAGAVAERVGRALLVHTEEVIVENGGDIFLDTDQEAVIGILAGVSPLSSKFGLKIDPSQTPLGVCTSSGTVGHSRSFGCADAVCVVSASCALPDAAATAIANQVRCPGDINSAVQRGRDIRGVLGVLIISGDQMGMWGQIELAAMSDGRHPVAH